jgi:hypothetical protein
MRGSGVTSGEWLNAYLCVVWLAVSGGAHRVFQVDYKSPTTFITINSIIFIITIIIIIIIIIIIMK